MTGWDDQPGDSSGVNCLIVRGPDLQHMVLRNERTGEVWHAGIGGDPFIWRWWPEGRDRRPEGVRARHEAGDDA